MGGGIRKGAEADEALNPETDELYIQMRRVLSTVNCFTGGKQGHQRQVSVARRLQYTAEPLGEFTKIAAVSVPPPAILSPSV